MSTEVATRAGSALIIQDGQDFWSEKQIAGLRQLGVEDATNGDLAIFFHHCQRTGLDPFARQIYMVGRWSKGGMKYTIQTGIDGLRLVADRADRHTGLRRSYEDTLWCGPDGVWRDVWLSTESPAAAKVTVLRGGARFSAVALFSEYRQTTKDGSLTQMWREKGVLMIAKCAEALALRKAYPQDLSGLYTSDEMGATHTVEQIPDDPAPAPEPQPEPTEAITDDQRAAMGSAFQGFADMADFAADLIGRKPTGLDDLTADEAALILAAHTAADIIDAELVQEQP